MRHTLRDAIRQGLFLSPSERRAYLISVMCTAAVSGAVVVGFNIRPLAGGLTFLISIVITGSLVFGLKCYGLWLSARIEASIKAPETPFAVQINEVTVGTITHREWADIQIALARDPTVVLDQWLAWLDYGVRVLGRSTLFVTFVLFWAAVVTRTSPDDFADTCAVMSVALTLVMLATGAQFMFGRCTARAVRGDLLAERIRLRVAAPVRGDVRLVRELNGQSLSWVKR